MIRVLIVDDEPPAIRLLGGYVERTEGMMVAESFTNPIAALRYLQREKVDLILLDIQMPEINGMQFARIIGPDTPVILTTAYGQYAVESYELRVLDYLLKPISYERFVGATARLAAKEEPSVDQAGVPAARHPYFFVKVGHQQQRIDYDDLLYLAGNGDYVTLMLASGIKILTLENLSDLVKRLPSEDFIRIHRSYVIAQHKIEYLEKNRIRVGDELLPVSETYRESVKRALGID